MGVRQGFFSDRLWRNCAPQSSPADKQMTGQVIGSDRPPGLDQNHRETGWRGAYLVCSRLLSEDAPMRYGCAAGFSTPAREENYACL